MPTLTSSNIATARRKARDGSPAFIDALANPNVKTATAAAGAATCNGIAGMVTSEALTSAQNAIYTLTIANNLVAAGDLVLASVCDGTNTQGTPMVARAKATAGQVVITVANKHATAEALNGTIVVGFKLVKAGDLP